MPKFEGKEYEYSKAGYRALAKAKVLAKKKKKKKKKVVRKKKRG